jgi:DNA-binding Xre family transcriptional regulator
MSLATMLEKTPQTAKRKRGVLLSQKGWKRLQLAEQNMRGDSATSSKSYTLQELSELTGLSPNTLARVKGRRIPVDLHTLESYFRAFSLAIIPEDFMDSDMGSSFGSMMSIPVGQLPLDSPLYIARSPVESICADGIGQPGGLIRIKAARQMGKTSLVARTLGQVRGQGVSTVMLSLRLADSGTFQDLQRFLKWFCAVVSHNLGLTSQVEETWDDLFGASYNCTHYFEQVILKHISGPLVLALDEVDVVFDYPEIASDFLSMLRAWYEKARYGDGSSELWQKLRLILVHSTEVYVPLSLAHSPFNAGWLVELPGFNAEQIEELARHYRLEQVDVVANTLLEWMGGNPFMTHLALYHLSQSDASLATMVKRLDSTDGIYGAHLRHQMWELQKDAELVAAFKLVLRKDDTSTLEPRISYKLQSNGWVRSEGGQLVPGCRLYETFFRKALPNLA